MGAYPFAPETSSWSLTPLTDSEPPPSDFSQHRVSNIAYNVVNGKCTPVRDQSAPVYITIGDGGNLEGLATK